MAVLSIVRSFFTDNLCTACVVHAPAPYRRGQPRDRYVTRRRTRAHAEANRTQTLLRTITMLTKSYALPFRAITSRCLPPCTSAALNFLFLSTSPAVLFRRPRPGRSPPAIRNHRHGISTLHTSVALAVGRSPCPASFLPRCHRQCRFARRKPSQEVWRPHCGGPRSRRLARSHSLSP